ncbi:hypothetical protein BJ875DRAFT_200566 [Amylocarpus encephaloides]|uniref:Uncharacterized protein n=1 Tax=Amylocarpus encephaloides TaxID=45428 RepID=A0A9P7Y918_9HELO|nr:hypothetical protein BJ875DRAFT_200566 [Amylocarpus encephaloides]
MGRIKAHLTFLVKASLRVVCPSLVFRARVEEEDCRGVLGKTTAGRWLGPVPISYVLHAYRFEASPPPSPYSRAHTCTSCTCACKYTFLSALWKILAFVSKAAASPVLYIGPVQTVVVQFKGTASSVAARRCKVSILILPTCSLAVIWCQVHNGTCPLPLPLSRHRNRKLQSQAKEKFLSPQFPTSSPPQSHTSRSPHHHITISPNQQLQTPNHGPSKHSSKALILIGSPPRVFPRLALRPLASEQWLSDRSSSALSLLREKPSCRYREDRSSASGRVRLIGRETLSFRASCGVGSRERWSRRDGFCWLCFLLSFRVEECGCEREEGGLAVWHTMFVGKGAGVVERQGKRPKGHGCQ